jgi:hypothetical protein
VTATQRTLLLAFDWTPPPAPPPMPAEQEAGSQAISTRAASE